MGLGRAWMTHSSCSIMGLLEWLPLAEGIWAISLDAHLPIAACVGVPGLDGGHTLAHRAVLRHTNHRVGGEVKPGAVVILIQHSDVDLDR